VHVPELCAGLGSRFFGAVYSPFNVYRHAQGPKVINIDGRSTWLPFKSLRHLPSFQFRDSTTWTHVWHCGRAGGFGQRLSNASSDELTNRFGDDSARSSRKIQSIELYWSSWHLSATVTISLSITITRKNPIDDELRSAGRRLTWARLVAPKQADVSLDGGWIVSKDPMHYPSADYRELVPPPDLLARFIGLRDQDAKRFGEFAKKYGGLALCHDYGLPASHYFDCQPATRESVNRWRDLSMQAYTILRVRDLLNRGDEVLPTDWQTALGVAADSGGTISWANQARRRTSFTRFGQRELAACVQGWLNVVQIGPRVTWDGKSSTYQLRLKPSESGPNLFAHLALQLMQAVANVDRLAICSGCGNSYTPTRRPNENRLNFCQSCGRRAAVRLAMRRKRKQDREGGSKERDVGKPKR